MYLEWLRVYSFSHHLLNEMVVSGYYVTVETKHKVDTSAYAATAEALTHALFKVLGDPVKFRNVAQQTTFSGARVEVEISQSVAAHESQVIARAVVQADAEDTWKFDKTLFSSMIRTELEWPVVVTKRAVPKDEQMSIFSDEFTVYSPPPAEEEA